MEESKQETKIEPKPETKEDSKHEETPPSETGLTSVKPRTSTAPKSSRRSSKASKIEEKSESTEKEIDTQQNYDKWLKTKTLSSDMKDKLYLLFYNPISENDEYRVPPDISYEQMAKTLAAIDLYYGNWKADIKKREKRCGCSSEKCIMCGGCIRVCNVLYIYI